MVSLESVEAESIAASAQQHIYSIFGVSVKQTTTMVTTTEVENKHRASSSNYDSLFEHGFFRDVVSRMVGLRSRETVSKVEFVFQNRSQRWRRVSTV